MREIKFRVWSKSSKTWIPKSEGCSEYNFIQYKNSPFSLFGISPECIEIQQFTGLLDSKGKEIYEGDIVKDLDGDNCVVEFHHGSFLIKGKTIIPFLSILSVNGEYSVRTLSSQVFEIIGNIFENSELLK